MYDMSPSIVSMVGFVLVLAVYHAIKLMSDGTTTNARFTVASKGMH